MNQIENKIELTPVIPETDINNLIKEDELAQEKSDNTLINEYSNLIIQSIQSAWIKPQNIQDGLVCDLRMTINKILICNCNCSQLQIDYSTTCVKDIGSA